MTNQICDKKAPKKARAPAEKPAAMQNLAEFLMNSPLRGSRIQIERIRGFLRKVDF